MPDMQRFWQKECRVGGVMVTLTRMRVRREVCVGNDGTSLYDASTNHDLLLLPPGLQSAWSSSGN